MLKYSGSSLYIFKRAFPSKCSSLGTVPVSHYAPSCSLSEKKNSKSLIQNLLPYLNLFLYHYPKFL